MTLKRCLAGTFASCFCHHQRHTQEIFLRTEHYSQRHWKLPEWREQNSSLHVRHGQDRELPTSDLKKSNARSSPEPLGMCARSKLHRLLPALGGIGRQLALTWPPDSAGCAVRKSGGHLLVSTILSMEHGSPPLHLSANWTGAVRTQPSLRMHPQGDTLSVLAMKNTVLPGVLAKPLANLLLLSLVSNPLP